MSVVLSELRGDEESVGGVAFQSVPGHGFGGVCEIEEEEEDPNELFEISHGVRMASLREDFGESLFSLDVGYREDNVYVAVGKCESSTDALAWTLKHAVTPSTIVYLVHVFPEIRHVATPLGKLPKSQANPLQLESHMAQERGKRRELLQKFLDMCSSSQVKADTMLIESDMVGKAILDLIPVLNVRKLVVGAAKSSLRKLRTRRGSGIADQLVQNAPEYCDVKIVCEGKEVSMEQMNGVPSPRSTSDDSPKPKQNGVEEQYNDSFSCACFKPKFL